MRRLLVLLLTATALVLTGCAQAPGAGRAPTSPAPTSPTLPPLHVIRTGGFAGVHDELQIETDGRWTLTGRHTDNSGELDDASLARLTELLADPRLPAEIAAMPTIGCCDQFTYTLRIAGTDYSFESFGEAGPLVAELLELLHEATGF